MLSQSRAYVTKPFLRISLRGEVEPSQDNMELGYVIQHDTKESVEVSKNTIDLLKGQNRWDVILISIVTHYLRLLMYLSATFSHLRHLSSDK